MTVDYTLKLILIRPSGIGKIIDKIVDRFSIDYKLTHGVDFLNKSIEFGKERIVKLSIWDIDIEAHRFDFLRKNYYEGAHGALIFFDLTHRETYEEAKKLWAEIKELKGFVPFLLIADNLNTLKMADSILRKEACDFARNEGGTFTEITPDNVDLLEKAISELVYAIIENYK
ncbi:MAG: hypothetical protein ACFFAI_18100 [Promethearchaeota archaeon]